MYVSPDCKSKKELKQRIANGEKVTVFSPAIFKPTSNGRVDVEGPNFQPHRWYAEVEVVNFVVTKVF